MSKDNMKSRAETVIDNYKRVLEDVESELISLGIDNNAVSILPISKGVASFDIATLINYGLKVYGESRVQEVDQKLDELNNNLAEFSLTQDKLKDLEFHFIGRLQSNKLKKIVDRFSLIHSVDSKRYLIEIDKLSSVSGVKQDILLQLNLAKEDSKTGLSEDTLDDVLEEVLKLDNITLRGFMLVTPYEDDIYKNEIYFSTAKKIYDKNIKVIKSIDTLSMGMSNDYKLALAYGSNLMRLGTIIFN